MSERSRQSRSGTVRPDTWAETHGCELRIETQAVSPGHVALADNRALPGPLDRALLALTLVTDGASHTLGSAALIAPGIALAAKHVVLEMAERRDAVGGNSQIYAIGVSADELDIWNIREFVCSTTSDIAIVTMDTGKPDYSSLRFKVFPISARMPAIGEPVVMAGFVADTGEVPISPERTGDIIVAGEHHISVGNVRELHPTGRDKVMLPDSCIEIEVNVRGGMSGGPAFDKNGHLIGLVTSSIDSEDGKGPTWVSLLWNALTRDFQASWPPNLYPQSPFNLLAAPFLEVKEGARLIAGIDGEPNRYIIGDD